MTGTSISDVQREWCKKPFTLRASQEAYAQIELELNESYAVVLTRIMKPVPRLTDVTAAFAALALPHGKYTGKTIRALMPAIDGGKSLIEARDFINAALEAASPKDGDTAPREGTEEDQTKSDPR